MKNKLEGVKSRIFNSLNEAQKKIFEEKWNKLYDIATKGVHDYNRNSWYKKEIKILIIGL